jgi:tRNA A37 threonylcarbamoyltransferase TsaD
MSKYRKDSRRPVILGLDSTGDKTVVGLLEGDKMTIKEQRRLPTDFDLLKNIDSLLSGRRPDAICVCLGPGSYTGTRLGVVIANTLAWVWGIPVYGLPHRHFRGSKELLWAGQKRCERQEKSPFVFPLYPP